MSIFPYCNYSSDTLNEIFLYNPETCYDILFKATSESILELAKDPKWLGAKVGITSILHTWGQTISFHPHIHSIVTGGGISNNKWIQSKKEYLNTFPYSPKLVTIKL